MDPFILANSINKWLHLTSAAYLVGAVLYLRFVLLPGIAGLPENERESVWRSVQRRSFRYMSWATVLLFLTGMDNIMRARKTLGGLSVDLRSGYWTAFWMKMAFYVGALLIVHILLIRAPVFRPFQEKPRGLIGYLLVLALAIIFLSGYLTLTRLSLLR